MTASDKVKNKFVYIICNFSNRLPTIRKAALKY